MSLPDFVCGMLLKPLLDLGSAMRRGGEMALSLKMLDCYKGGSVSNIVALEGFDKLSSSLSWGCTRCCSHGNHQWTSVVCRSNVKGIE